MSQVHNLLVGDAVVLRFPRASATTGRTLKVGTPGVVKATRSDGAVLVKFRGVSYPMAFESYEVVNFLGAGWPSK